MENETAGYRRKRKEDAKSLKRERIVKAGGVRPRHIPPDGSEKCLCPVKESSAKTANFQTTQRPTDSRNRYSDRNASTSQNHRFGRVMEKVPCRNQPRFSTLSIAIPGSIVANCQTRELKTQIAGQIARAATIYHVDEIIVFDDKLSKSVSLNNYYRNRDDSKRRHFERTEEFNKETKKGEVNSQEGESSERSRSSDPHAFMARVLQYCGCPQYLRRHFFPMHPDLQFAGLLAPVDAPHHVRAEDRCPFREGVILDKTKGTGSLVNCGIRGRPVQYVPKCLCWFQTFCKL